MLIPNIQNKKTVDLVDTLTLSIDQQALNKVLQWLEEVALRHNWEPGTAHALILCLDEALSNVLMHAIDPATCMSDGIKIAIRCVTDNNVICLELIDNGPPFDPTTISLPTLPNDIQHAKIGGHGLRLMRHYLDALHYVRVADCNQLIMIRQRVKS